MLVSFHLLLICSLPPCLSVNLNRSLSAHPPPRHQFNLGYQAQSFALGKRGIKEHRQGLIPLVLTDCRLIKDEIKYTNCSENVQLKINSINQ